jgi:hypothetical protein
VLHFGDGISVLIRYIRPRKLNTRAAVAVCI